MKKISKELFEEWVELHNNGFSYAEISRMFPEYNYLVISRRLKRYYDGFESGLHTRYDYYLGEYTINLVSLDTNELCYMFNNARELKETFVNDDNIPERLTRIFKGKVKSIMLNNKRYIVKFVKVCKENQ